MTRPEEGDEQPIEVLDLRIDPAKRTVTLRGEQVPTTFVEFEILTALARTPGRVFTRDMLLARVWGDSAYRDPRTVKMNSGSFGSDSIFSRRWRMWTSMVRGSR